MPYLMPLKAGRHICSHCDLNNIFTWLRRKVCCELSLFMNEWKKKPLVSFLSVKCQGILKRDICVNHESGLDYLR